MNTLDTLEVVPTGAALGAEVRGLDLALPVSDAIAQTLHDAWYEHLVLLFRGQALGDDAIMRTADIFGGSQGSGAHSYFNRNAAAFNPHRVEGYPASWRSQTWTRTASRPSTTGGSAATRWCGTATTPTSRYRPPAACSTRWKSRSTAEATPRLRDPAAGTQADDRGPLPGPRLEPQQRRGAAPRGDVAGEAGGRSGSGPSSTAGRHTLVSHRHSSAVSRVLAAQPARPLAGTAPTSGRLHIGRYLREFTRQVPIRIEVVLSCDLVSDVTEWHYLPDNPLILVILGRKPRLLPQASAELRLPRVPAGKKIWI